MADKTEFLSLCQEDPTVKFWPPLEAVKQNPPPWADAVPDEPVEEVFEQSNEG